MIRTRNERLPSADVSPHPHESSAPSALAITPQTELLYLYCAVRPPVASRRLKKLPAMPDGSAPRLLPLTRDISLAAASVSGATYSGAAIESRLNDLDWVARCGSSHHAVVDTLALEHTVVPFRLFTVFADESSARATLGPAAPRIAAAMARLRGRAEWVLRIGVPEPGRGAHQEVSGPRAPASGTSFLARKAAARRAAAEVAEMVRHDANAVFDRIAALADAANRRPPDTATGLVLDAAFLVRTRRQPALKRELAAAARRLLANGCRVSLTGPWPPYSFVHLTEPGVA